MNSPPTLCLVLRAPHPGTVKTRLAASIGTAVAAEVYRRLVEHQASEIPGEWRVEVHFTPAGAEAEMHNWLAPLLPEQTVFHPQAEGDCGARLRAALAGAATRGAREILFVGGDCPQLTAERLRSAALVLHAADFVIIPAVRGGYVLIGLASPHAHAFDDIVRSTSAELAETQRIIHAHGMNLQSFTPLEDVDDLHSLLRARQYCPALTSLGDYSDFRQTP